MRKHDGNTNWFAVDRRGLAKLIERKGKQFILYELWQNITDEDATEAVISLKRLPGGKAELIVADDNPDGFADLTHAFTLFAESAKKTDPEKRGRFNLGEKLVLALCEEASIKSTRGTVVFDKSGRHERREKLDRGTVFTATLKLTASEFAEFEQAAQRLLPSAKLKTSFNGAVIEPRQPLAQIEATLPTEIGDSEGILRATTRKTLVEVVETVGDETPMLYEMGIPVVEHDGRWHINVMQKVPLNMDRDNVTPSYLGKVRALVTDHMAEVLTSEDANSAWVRDAVTRHGETMATETITRLADLRFGEKRVIHDPTDPEANALAVSRGYTVVHGRSLNKAEWDAVRRTGAILPAGRVTPSPKPFSEDGEPLKMMQPEKITDSMRWFMDYAAKLGRELLGANVSVRLANDIGWGFAGCYGPGSLTVNVGRLGYAWFDGSLAKINEFVLHEYGHHYSGNHLSEEYHDALCRLGGRLSQLALDKPKLFKRK
jgi:hypothetical protein